MKQYYKIIKNAGLKKILKFLLSKYSLDYIKAYYNTKNYYYKKNNIANKKNSKTITYNLFIDEKYTNENVVDFKTTKKKYHKKIEEQKKIYKILKKNYFYHKFNVLGLGWVESKKFKNNIEEKKFYEKLNKKNKKLFLQIKKNNKDYKFISWNEDLNTDFKWNNKWYKLIRIENNNSDIKLPWELSRMYHILQVIYYSFLFDNKEEQKKIIKETKNQILDFIIQNPIYYSVNWTCAMEVGIRAINLIYYFNILKLLEKKLNLKDEYFEKIFLESVYEHGKFIIENLEYNKELTSNHYLADITGLLYIALFLEKNSKINSKKKSEEKNKKEIQNWFYFSIKEIKKEYEKQFYEEGTNFEGSTAYHILSTQMILLSYFILKKYNGKILFQKKFDIKKHLDIEEKLLKSLIFIDDITKKNKNIIQIGDNDSGRIIKPIFYGKITTINEVKEKYESFKTNIKEKTFLDENLLLYENILSFSNNIFSNELFEEKKEEYILDYYFGKLFYGETIKKETEKNKKTEKAESKKTKVTKKELEKKQKEKQKTEEIEELKEIKKVKKLLKELKYKKTSEIHIKKYITLKNLEIINYKKFGLTIIKSKNKDFYLSIYNAPLGQKGFGGHSHNDKLSIELNIKGKDLIVDPGVYVYTSNVNERNKFRSTKAHSVPYTFEEQAYWYPGRIGLFSLKGKITTKNYVIKKTAKKTIKKPIETLHYLEFESEKNENRHEKQKNMKNKNDEKINNKKNNKTILIRKIKIENKKIIIEDYSNKKFTPLFNTFKLFSEGYGKKYSKKELEKKQKEIKKYISINTNLQDTVL